MNDLDGVPHVACLIYGDLVHSKLVCNNVKHLEFRVSGGRFRVSDFDRAPQDYTPSRMPGGRESGFRP